MRTKQKHRSFVAEYSLLALLLLSSRAAVGSGTSIRATWSDAQTKLDWNDCTFATDGQRWLHRDLASVTENDAWFVSTRTVRPSSLTSSVDQTAYTCMWSWSCGSYWEYWHRSELIEGYDRRLLGKFYGYAASVAKNQLSRPSSG